MVDMGFHPIPHHFMAGRRGAGGVRVLGFGARKVKGLGQTWGKAPYPLLGRGKCEKVVLPGAHILCKHAITGKRIAGDAGSAGGFCRLGIRAQKVKGLG